MALESYTFEAPAHWASAFINGDLTSFSDADEREYLDWREANLSRGSHVVNCSEEPFVGRFHGLLTDMLEYTALAPLEES